MKKKLIILGIIVAAVCVFFAIKVVTFNSTTPLEAVEKRWGQSDYFTAIDQLNLSKSLTMIVFEGVNISGNSHINVCLVKKNILSYAISIDTFPKPDIESENAFLCYHSSRDGWVLCGGILYDGDVSRVIVNGNEMSIVEVKDGSRWYWTGGIERLESIDYVLYDAEGNVIESGREDA